jgi:hypothetical protein
MASERAMYWMAVGLMGVLLGNHFIAKHDRCLRDARAGAQSILERARNLAPPELLPVPFEAQLASMRAKLADQRAAFAVLQGQRAQMLAMEQIEAGRVHGICPRQHVRIRIPETTSVPTGGTI